MNKAVMVAGKAGTGSDPVVPRALRALRPDPTALAERAGVSEATLESWRLGRREPSQDARRRFADTIEAHASALHALAGEVRAGVAGAQVAGSRAAPVVSPVGDISAGGGAVRPGVRALRFAFACPSCRRPLASPTRLAYCARCAAYAMLCDGCDEPFFPASSARQHAHSVLWRPPARR